MEYMESQMQNQIEAAMEQEDNEPFVQVLVPFEPNATLSGGTPSAPNAGCADFGGRE